MFDVHTHIQFPAYDGDREEVIKRAQKSGVKMIAVGTTYQTSKEAVEVAEKYPKDIWATAGFHPAHTYSQYHDKKELREMVKEDFDLAMFGDLARNKKVVAIGECGLDYYRISGDKSKIIEKQKEIFNRHIKLAENLRKPLMIHCRPSKGSDDAYEDLLVILNGSYFTGNKIVHFFAGSAETAKKLLKAGCFFTFGGAITFSSDYESAIKQIPLNKIMLETDAPYVAPTPYRGRRNEPAYVTEVAKKMAEILGISYEKVVGQTTSNVMEVFFVS